MNDTHYTSRKVKWRRIRAAAAAAAGTAAAMAAFIAGAHGAAAGTPAATLSQGVIVHGVDGGLAPYNAATPHCVVNLSTNAQRCFVHFRDAIAYGTGNRVTDAPNDSRTAATDQHFNAEINRLAQQVHSQVTKNPGTAQPQIPVPIADEYFDINYTGVTWTAVVDNGYCDNDGADTTDYYEPYLGPTWNDQISSFHGYANCDQRSFQDINFGGQVLSLRTYDYNLTQDPGPSRRGNWNDVISSIEWT